jgi:uncharacterized protein (TIGR02271 family)
MAHQLFSETDDWELENDDQDIRGYSVVDEQGQTLGTVRDMYVDTDTETIDRLVLDNGQEIDVASASVEDGVIRVGGLGGTTAGYDTTTTDYGTTDTAEVTTATAATATTGYATNASNTTEGPWRIRRHAEELRAQTQQQQVGEVRIDKDVVEEQQTIDVPVTREQVEVRRYAVDRPASEAQIVDTGDTIRVPVIGERVEVSKEAHVVEEVEVAKTARTETQQVSDTVRREEINVDQQGDVNVSDDVRR